MENIIIERNKTKAILLFAGEFLLLFLSIKIWFFGIHKKLIIIWLVGMILTVVLGIYFIILLSRVLEKKPLLTITFEGIIYNSAACSAINISFQDIERFCIISFHGKQVIGIIPKNEKEFIIKLPAVKQVEARSNTNINCPPFFIRTYRAQDMTTEDIFTLLDKRLEDYSCLYD